MAEYWENDEQVQPSNEKWWEADESPSIPAAQSYIRQQDRDAYVREAGSAIGNSVWPSGKAALMELATDVQGQGARLLGDLSLSNDFQDRMHAHADKLHRIGNYIEQAAQQRDQNGIVPPIVARAGRGVMRTVPNMMVAGRIGGAPGAIGAAAHQEYSQAIQEGKDAGLTGDSLHHYAKAQGAIEGGIAGVFQAIGLGGAEQAVAKPLRAGIVNALKEAGKQTLVGELPEELLTELAHAAARKAAGTDPTALTPDNLKQIGADTTLQTLLTMGLVESPRIADAAIEGRRQAQQQATDPALQAKLDQIQSQYEAESPQRAAAQSRTDAIRQAIAKQRQNAAQQPAEPTTPASEPQVDNLSQPNPEPEQPPAEPPKKSILKKKPVPSPEPPVPPGHVRVYHSGGETDGSPRWVSTNRDYASNYRPDLPLHYLDLPENDPRLNDPDYPDQGAKNGFTFNFELPAEEAARLKQIQRPQEPQNASPVRSDPRQTGQPGNVSQGSEVPRGQDLQQPAPVEPGRPPLGREGEAGQTQPVPEEKPVGKRPDEVNRRTPPLEDWFGPDADVQIKWSPSGFGKTRRGDIVSVDFHDGNRMSGVVESGGSNFVDVRSNGKITRVFQGEGLLFEGRRVQRGQPETPKVDNLSQPSAAITKYSAEPPKVITDDIAAKKRDYSSTQVTLPPDIAASVQAVGQKITPEDLAEKGLETEPHVTVKYGLHTDFGGPVRKALENEPPIRLKLGPVSMFENGEHDVVKSDVESADLVRLNKKLADALPHTDTHPTYQPHVTIAYVKPGMGKKYVGNRDLEGIELIANKVTFSDKSGKQITIPLTGTRTIGPAPSTAPVNYGTVDSPSRSALGDYFGSTLAAGASYPSINDARKAAGKLLGGDVHPGTLAAKHIDEAVENGVVRAARQILDAGGSDSLSYDRLIDLYQRQPNLAVRTSTSISQQAYSTPAPLAWLVNVMVNVQPNDTVYDSAAGNGMLLIGASKALANELNPERATAIKENKWLPVEKVTTEDATKYRPSEPVDVVIINPPFGTVQDENGNDRSWNANGLKTTAIDHAIAANTLPAMTDDGRAVLILGGKGFEAGEAKDDLRRAKAYLGAKAFYDHVWDNYNVTDHFTVAGDLYARQGAKFPVDVVVINGKGVSSRPKPYNFKAGGLPAVFSTWEDLKNAKLHRGKTEQGGLANQRPAGGLESSRPSPGGATEPGSKANDVGAVPRPVEGQAQVDVGQGPKPQEPPRKRLGPKSGGNASTEQAGGPGGQSGVSEPPPRKTLGPQRPVSPASEPGRESGGGNPEQRPGPLAAESGPASGGLNDNQKQASEKKQPAKAVQQDAETEYQVSYTPGSSKEGVGTLVPKTQAAAVQKALAAIQEKHGDIDTFVANQLDYKKGDLGKYFSAEQVDALAMIIAKHQEGKAFILGDQTGVGKGRVAAAMMRYAKLHRLVPVFVTQDPSLYRDMVRDLGDIGMNTAAKPFEPLPTNDLSGKKVINLPDGRTLKQTSQTAKKRFLEAADSFHKTGDLKSGGKTYDAVFTTYSQLQPVKGELVDRHNILKSLAPRAFFILDESHNAGGSGELDEKGNKQGRDQDEEDVITRASFIRELIAPASGVTFLSATFSKRPEVMDLYAKTGIADAVANSADLASAIKYGGVPLQQAVSEMLSEAGVYLRRERSYDGVEFNPKVVNIDLGTADKVSEVYRAIQKFDSAKNGAIEDGDIESTVVSGGGKVGKDNATGESGITSTNFSSILWNLTDQMLMALKADAAAQEAIDSWKKGETPVVVVDNTIESGLNYYLEDNPTDHGNHLEFSFRDLLNRYLERSREILVKHDVNDPKSWERVRLTDEELGEKGVALYNAAKDLIDGFDANLPASPIDWMRMRMKQAGMKVAEITGRKNLVNYSPDGSMTLEERPDEEFGNEGKGRTVDAINSGSLDAVILNRSGATGLSLHASEKFKNQKPRHMVIAQPAKNIDEFMQVLGRVHRTGQVKKPRYTLLMSNAPAETRPAAVLVKKLASLNANVTASAKGSVSFDVPDVINKVGDQVVADYIGENPELNAELGDPVDFDRSGRPKYAPNLAKKVTGRVVLLPVEQQQQFWDDVIEAFNTEIAELDRTNQNPLVAKTLDIGAHTVESFPIFQGDEGSDNPFLQPGSMEKVRAKKIGEPMKPEEVKERVQKFYGGYEPTAEMGRNWEATQRDAARKYLAQQFEKRQEKLADPEDRKKLQDQYEKIWDRFNMAFRWIAPGQNIEITEYDDEGMLLDSVTGVVIDVKRKGKGPNVASLSQWVAEIALPTPDRVMRVPLSRIGMADQAADSEGDGGAVKVSQRRSFADDEDYQNFSQPRSTHETRYIGTGNILAAAGELVKKRGRVTFFTDDKGEVKRGVLMPRSFNGDKWASERPAVFNDAQQVYDFLTGYSNSYVVTPDKAIAIRIQNGKFVLTAPKSKQQGGKYTTNPKVMAAAKPDEFVSVGGRMELSVPKAKGRAVIQSILDLAPLQTDSHKTEARNIIDAGNLPRSLKVDKLSQTSTEGMDDSGSDSGTIEPIGPQVNRRYKVQKNGGKYEIVSAGDFTKRVFSTADEALKESERLNNESLAKYSWAEWDKMLHSGMSNFASGDELSFSPGEQPTRKKSPSTRQSRSENIHSPEDDGIAAADIVKTWERLFKVPIRVGGFSKRAAGIYKVLPEIVRTKEKHYGNLAVAAHEIAHHIDKQTGIAGADSRKARAIPMHLRGEVSGMDYEPKGRLFEGFAEFVRHYLTEGDAQTIAPNFYDWFTKEWMPDHPEWAKPLEEARQQAMQYANQSVLQRIRAAIGRPGDDLSWSARAKQRLSDFGRRLARQWLDKFAEVKWLQDAAEKQGLDLSKKAGPYETIMAYDMTADANASQALEDGVHALTDGRKLGPSLWDLAKHLRNDVEREEAVAYAWARHTLFMQEHQPGYSTGLDRGDARNMVEYVESDPDKHQRYEKVAKGIAEYANATLDMLVDAGALAPAERNKMIQSYGDHYFPLLRVQGDQQSLATGGARFVNLPKPVRGRSAQGSGRGILDPFDSLVSLTIQRYARAAKARVQQSLASTVDPRLGGAEGMGGLMDRVDPGRKVHQGKIEEILDTLVDEGVVEPDDARAMKIASKIRQGEFDKLSQPDLEWFAQRHGLAEDDDVLAAADSEPDILATISLWRPDFTPNAKKATVLIHTPQGKPVLYEMDRAIYDTVNGMDGIQFAGFANVLRNAMQVFKAGAVGISTGFGVTNLIRDYLEYQGRAEHVEGAKSLGKPLEMVARYAGYKARKLAGLEADDALIETFEAAGGKLFTRLGSDIAARQRQRKRKLGQERLGNVLESPFHLKDAALTAAESLQDVIAWTDAPPRLAEMQAAAREMGFESRGKDWVDIASGQVVNLPEYAKIRMLNAAAEATVNFKRSGALGRYVDAFVPFANATLQASLREAKQFGALKSLGKSDENGQRALRYLVYLASAASVGWLVWLLRHDDDDYREQEPWLKEQYWTWGKDGKTYLRVPKPRDAGGLVSSLAEAALDAAYHDDAQGAMAGVVGRHAMGRLPSGGGPVRGAVETFVADYDYFRDRPLTPDYLKDEPKALRYTPYTTETSKALGKVTAPTIGLSPIQVEHLLNSSTGGAYRRWAETAESAYEGRVGPEHVPFLRGLVLNRHQARSLDDFYVELQKTRLAAKLEDANGRLSDDTVAKKGRLDDYAALMTEIRRLDPRDLKGRRKFEFEGYLVGLAREALDRGPLESNPSPFHDPDLPDAVKGAIVKFAEQRAKNAILSHGMPTKAHKGDADYDETLAKWEQGRAADEAWLKEHKDSPYVQEALRKIRTSKAYRDLLTRQNQPKFLQGHESWDSHLAETRRWMNKVNRAASWLDNGRLDE